MLCHRNIVDSKNIEERRKFLYEKFKKNPKVSEEITIKNKRIDELKIEIDSLKNKLEDEITDLNILLEIKNSMKISLLINETIDTYLKNLKNQELLNNWKITLSTDSETSSTKIYSIKNATYTGLITINHSKKKNFYRIDTELSLASVLLNLVKEHKKKYLETNNITIIKSGKIIFREEEIESFIEKTKKCFEKYFLCEKAPLIKDFKDSNKNRYCADDFLIYDGLIIDGYSIVEENIEYNEENPF